MSTLSVAIDERMRLVTAVLAVSDWPVEEQNRLTHAVHPHAKQVRHFMQHFASHPAVNGVNEALLNGVNVADLFSAALRCTWPDFTPEADLPNVLKIEAWVASLAGFAQQTAVATDFWPQHTAVWQEAQTALVKIFNDGDLLAALGQLGDVAVTAVTLMPNLVFPALTPVVATADSTVTLLLPPPKAVGESPPWPFDEDPGWVVATVAGQLAQHLLAADLNQLDEAERPLAIHLATAHCLAQLLDEFEAQAYLLRAKKAHNLPQLPALFAQLQEEVLGGNGRSLSTILQN
ncbi:hypothetical protein [Candidatus Leptofilum sp.]|uniref:hypothetical protein n=1 Tax=Candidatus Leptofilum sp. TaxID=3241576 RepID=UPI003B5BFEE4